MQDTNTLEAQQQTDMLRESAVDFVRRTVDTKKVRERRRTLPGYDAGTLSHMAELGWLGILVPEAHGGLGLGFAEMAVVLQELGKGLMALAAPGIADAAIGVKRGITDRFALVHGKQTLARIEVAGAGAALHLRYGGRLEPRQVSRSLVVERDLGGFVPW